MRVGHGVKVDEESIQNTERFVLPFGCNAQNSSNFRIKGQISHQGHWTKDSPLPDGWGIVQGQMDPIHGGPCKVHSWGNSLKSLSVGLLRIEKIHEDPPLQVNGIA